MDSSKNFELDKFKEMSPSECTHPSTSKEVFLGTSTGDRVCDHCGTVGSPDFFKKPIQSN